MPRQAKEVMNQPVVSIEQDKLVTDAVNLMLKKQVKRLPVIDADGRLIGHPLPRGRVSYHFARVP